ncbi:MAG: ORF6N domain-containing protein [Arcobacteraceae bacterium]|nr:ORF6N domain-containing protein [Arcobacteraceae bacterium]
MSNITTTTELISNKIYNIRGLQVMIDRDLAELYHVETRRLNEQVKRNIERFPEEFMFQLSKEEFENWKSQFATSNDKMGLRKIPYVFTEQGVSMLATVLNSWIAIDISIKIIKAFVNMRKFISNNALVFQRLDLLEQKQFQTDTKIEQVLNALEDKTIKPKQGIFYDGQIYDAYAFVNDLLKNTKRDIVLIDNYIDDTVFTLLSKYQNINIKIYTQTITKQLNLDYQKYKAQYNNIQLQEFKKSHDRFLIIDNQDIYHIGASLKDLGKKWFAFSKFEMGSFDILERLKENISY